MAKKLFQRPVFCKQLTDVTLICNQQAAIGAYPFNRKSHKMVKHTQTIRWQFGDELFEYV